MAYGKRARIANSIAELRPSPSLELPAQQSNSHLSSPTYSHMQFLPTLSDGDVAPMMHSRMKSIGQQSHHSFPGSGKSGFSKHKYTQSLQSSVVSGAGPLPQHQQEEAHEAVTTPIQDMSGSGLQDDTTTSVGLGIRLPSNEVRLSSHLAKHMVDNSSASSFTFSKRHRSWRFSCTNDSFFFHRRRKRSFE